MKWYFNSHQFSGAQLLQKAGKGGKYLPNPGLERKTSEECRRCLVEIVENQEKFDFQLIRLCHSGASIRYITIHPLKWSARRTPKSLS